MKLAPALTNPIPECPHRSCILKTKTCIDYSTGLCSTPAKCPLLLRLCPHYPPLPQTAASLSFPPPRERSNGPMHEHAVEAIRLKASPRLTEGSLSTHGSCFIPFAISFLLRPVGQRNLLPSSTHHSSQGPRACLSLEPLTSLPSSASTSFAYHWFRHQRFDRADARHSISPIALDHTFNCVAEA